MSIAEGPHAHKARTASSSLQYASCTPASTYDLDCVDGLLACSAGAGSGECGCILVDIRGDIVRVEAEARAQCRRRREAEVGERDIEAPACFSLWRKDNSSKQRIFQRLMDRWNPTTSSTAWLATTHMVDTARVAFHIWSITVVNSPASTALAWP